MKNPIKLKKETESVKTPKVGRRSTSFEDSSEKAKRRKTQDIRASYSASELAYAAQMQLRKEGKSDAAAVVTNVTVASPTTAKQYRSSLELSNEGREVLTSDEALSLLIEIDLSRNRYQSLRNALLAKKDKVLPSYKHLARAKKNCYPAHKIAVTETSAEIDFASLLEHTLVRILHLQADVVDRFSEDQLKNLTFICKWGCDGSSGHSRYKQKFSETDVSDENVLFLALVPLQLIIKNESSNDTSVLWKNPRPSSPRFCRPIKIMHEKETSDLVQKETNSIQKQIDQLKPYEALIHRKNVVVRYQLSLTMIDGKVCNALTSTTSAQRCFLCGATSKDFNDIESILKRNVNEDNYRFGISSLHAWIRCFESLLHVSYKLDVQCWQVRKQSQSKKSGKVKSAEEEKKYEEKKEEIEAKKAKIEETKKKIQAEFKAKLFLLVDMPKPGYGSTNDGNTARRFFENYEKSALITGLDKDLIYRFYIILQTISSGFTVDNDKFSQYTLDTARKWVELYNWYPMPTTVHKLLIHGPNIVRHALLPIGQMSEEAQEACNKYFKKYRDQFARKNFRQETMKDVFGRFLISSDPLVSSCRKLPHKPLKSLSSEVISLLASPSPSLEMSDSFSHDPNIYTDSDSLTDTSVTSGPEDYSDEEESFLF